MDPQNKITFYSCLENLEERFVGQQKKGHYAKSSFYDSPAKKEFHYIKPGDALEIGPFHITTQPLLHPGGSISYKIKTCGKTFIFATDTEFYGPDLSRLIHEYFEFFQGADLMIMDAQYSLQEAEQKKGWGHTAMTIAVDCCIHWQIKKLVLTHHEPAHNDEKIFELYDKADSYLDQSNPRHQPLKIYLACEGDTYNL
jgi:phosphoribosyl 1,2-cyclic phosphodiesterase